MIQSTETLDLGPDRGDQAEDLVAGKSYQRQVTERLILASPSCRRRDLKNNNIIICHFPR